MRSGSHIRFGVGVRWFMVGERQVGGRYQAGFGLVYRRLAKGRHQLGSWLACRVRRGVLHVSCFRKHELHPRKATKRNMFPQRWLLPLGPYTLGSKGL